MRRALLQRTVEIGLAASLALLALPPSAQAGEQAAARRAGSELAYELLLAPAWDSNAAREAEEGGAPTADGLGLILGRAELGGRLGRALGYGSTFEGGAKHFFREQQENSLILQLSAQLAVSLPGPFSLLLALDAKDRQQPAHRRSYRSGDVSAGLGLHGPGGLSFSGRGLLLGFLYADDADYDHSGWGAELSSLWQRSWLRLHSSLRWLELGYRGVRLIGSGRLDPTGAQRSDRLLRLDLEARQVGVVVASQALYVQWTDSSSSGSDNRRLGGRGSLSAALPLELDLSCRATLLWARYESTSGAPDDDDPTFGVEDEETRSSLTLALRRPLWASLWLEARWSRYFTLLDGPTYRRDVLLLGVRYAGEI
ncbi:MAG: hypothetical protein FJ125_12760 [Deltaproteobacteria bacterium]|nr:hypothetical protein [Deltaproteobacteria bacterium]